MCSHCSLYIFRMHFYDCVRCVVILPGMCVFCVCVCPIAQAGDGGGFESAWVGKAASDPRQQHHTSHNDDDDDGSAPSLKVVATKICYAVRKST